MALITLHSSHILSLKPHLHIIKSQHSSSSSSSSSKPTSQSNGSNPSTSSQGQGFGPRPEKKAGGGRREKGSVTRRVPVENPSFIGPEKGRADEEKKLKGENGFLLAWLGLGGVILFQGLALSVSGFLPEDWDKFLVKYLYPTFTPTVFLFVAGTTTYGVIKYLQNEKLKN